MQAWFQELHAALPPRHRELLRGIYLVHPRSHWAATRSWMYLLRQQDAAYSKVGSVLTAAITISKDKAISGIARSFLTGSNVSTRNGSTRAQTPSCSSSSCCSGARACCLQAVALNPAFPVGAPMTATSLDQ